MSKHKHYEMIVAKAANMELVVFAKSLKWREVDADDYQFFNQHDDYFLCLPQHKEACLHWLNGGDVLLRDFHEVVMESALESFAHRVWSKSTVFMDEDVEICIKPRKEKRYIGVRYDKKISRRTFNSEHDALVFFGNNYSIHEIEVEV